MGNNDYNFDANINEEYEIRRLEKEMEEKRQKEEEEAALKEQKKQTAAVSFADKLLKPSPEPDADGDAEDGTSVKKRPLWWLPGFRSNTLWKKIVATIIYAGLIFYVVTMGQGLMENEGYSPLNAFLWPTISFILPVLIIGNPGYADYKIPYYNQIPLWLRRLARLAVAACVWFVGVWASTAIGG